jgi:hypothetical protein
MARTKKAAQTDTASTEELAQGITPELGEAAQAARKKYTPEQMQVINQLAAALLSGVAVNLHPDAVLARTQAAYAHAEVMLAVSEDIANQEA